MAIDEYLGLESLVVVTGSTTVGDRAEELLTIVERSLRHHLDAGTIFLGRELPSVMAEACKAVEGAMNIEATALGISELLDEN